MVAGLNNKQRELLVRASSHVFISSSSSSCSHHPRIPIALLRSSRSDRGACYGLPVKSSERRGTQQRAHYKNLLHAFPPQEPDTTAPTVPTPCACCPLIFFLSCHVACSRYAQHKTACNVRKLRTHEYDRNSCNAINTALHSGFAFIDETSPPGT